jgi:hypothetical protein
LPGSGPRCSWWPESATTVDDDALAIDEPCAVGGEEAHDVGDVLRHSHAAGALDGIDYLDCGTVAM